MLLVPPVVRLRILALAATAFLAGAQFVLAEPEQPPRRATISPSLVHLDPGQEQKFKIVMDAPIERIATLATRVIWSVNGVAGGNAEIGTINAEGRYRAPAKTPKLRELHICGEVEDAANRFLWATVVIGASPPTYKSMGYWGLQVDYDSPSAVAKEFHGICLDPDGNLLISDQTSCRILRYSPAGKLLGEIGLGKGLEPGHFMNPRAVVCDAAGRFFVSDIKPAEPCIQVFGPDGGFLYGFAPGGTGPGCMKRPHGMDFDVHRRLFVTDVENARINVYKDSGEFLYSWGTHGVLPGEFNAPHGLTVDPSGDVFITGYYGPTQKFTSEGKFLYAFAHGDPPDGPLRFHSNAGDRWGNVYLLVRYPDDEEMDIVKSGGEKPFSIMKYNNNGDLVTSWTHTLPQYRESWAVVAEDGTIYSLCVQKKKEVGVEVFVEE